jgi:hypothetical protein
MLPCMTHLDHARSRNRQTLDDATIRDLAGLFRQPALTRQLLEFVDDGLDDYDGDVFLHEGDLHVAGNLCTDEEDVLLLVVRGDLIVDGAYSDSDDPQSMVLVTGSMKARDIVTAGFLEVHGDLEVKDRLIGDYNDCNAWIGGNVSCSLFFPEEHFFTVGGAFHAEHVLGNAKHRLECANPVEGIPMDSPRLLELLDHELLELHKEDDGTLTVDGFRDFLAFKRRILAGLPLRTG